MSKSLYDYSYDSQLCFEYTIDITPCPATGSTLKITLNIKNKFINLNFLTEAGLKSVLYKRFPNENDNNSNFGMSEGRNGANFLIQN